MVMEVLSFWSEGLAVNVNYCCRSSEDDRSGFLRERGIWARDLSSEKEDHRTFISL